MGLWPSPASHKGDIVGSFTFAISGSVIEHRGARVMPKEPQELTDYLYFDEKRLDQFFTQLSDPIKFEKTATLGVELSITGPKVSGSQTQTGRPFTTFKRIKEPAICGATQPSNSKEVYSKIRLDV